MTDINSPFAKLNAHRAAEARLTRQITMAKKIVVNGIFVIGVLMLTGSVALTLMKAVGNTAQINQCAGACAHPTDGQ